MPVLRIIVSLLGTLLLAGTFIESRTTDGAAIETQIYLILYAVGAVVLLTGLLMPLLRKGLKRSVVLRVISILMALIFLFLAGTAACIAVYPLFVPKADGTESLLLVLGAPQINNEPSRIMESRADKAAEYVRQHPDMLVVISGGSKGEGNSQSEAEMIASLMTQSGAGEARLALENNALTTEQNFQYAKDVFSQDYDLTREPVAVLTNWFHIFRLHYFADRQGFSSVRYITVPTPPSVGLIWYAREVILTIRYWLTGIS